MTAPSIADINYEVKTPLIEPNLAKFTFSSEPSTGVPADFFDGVTCDYSLKYVGQVLNIPAAYMEFSSTGNAKSDTQKVKILSDNNDFYFKPTTVGHPMTKNGEHPLSYQATCDFGKGITKTEKTLFKIKVTPEISDPDT